MVENSPYEGELPDAPLALVVRTRTGAGPLIVEYEAFGPDGSRQVYGRGFEPLVVIVRSTTGIVITGLPSATADRLTVVGTGGGPWTLTFRR